MSQPRRFAWAALLACGLALSFAGPAAAQRRPFGLRPVYRPVRPLTPVTPAYRPGYIDTSWQNSPYVYWHIHHRWPGPYPPYPYPPNPYPYPVPAPYPVPYPVPYYPVVDDGGSQPVTLVHNFYTPPPGSLDVPSDVPSTAVLPPPKGNTAVVAVVLPNEYAEVWFDGHKTNMTGSTRVFSTPDLTPGKSYHYTVKAVWFQGLDRVERERTVTVTAGQASVVDFTKDAK
jgi:uncharacterized protein (TIGR03000 family)